MAGPWEQYQQAPQAVQTPPQAAAPWAQYQSTPAAGGAQPTPTEPLQPQTPAEAESTPEPADVRQKYAQEAINRTAEESKQPEVGGGEAFVRGLGDGVSLGFQDEILAGLDAAVQPLVPVPENGSAAPTWRERYDENVANQRELLKAGQDQHPVASLAGGAVGSLAPMLVTGGLSGAASGASLAKNVGRGVVSGAAYGGAYGLGSAEGDLAERLPGAGKGAALGAVVGGAVPAVVGGVGAALRRSANSAQAELTAQQAQIQAARDAQSTLNASGNTADVVSERVPTVQAVGDAAMAPKRQQATTIADLAEEVAPNQQVLAAADRLGIRDQLIPSQYSRSQAYREIEQALASVPGSALNVQQINATKSLAQKADDLIAQYGGTTDKAGLSDRFRQDSLRAIEQVEERSNSLYDQVAAAIPATTQASPTATVALLNTKLTELGDRTLLSGAERRTLASLTRTDAQGNIVAPTYAGLDQIRKQVGAGLRGAGPFKDAESGSLRQLYAALSDDQQRVAESMGVGQVFTAAKSLVSQRKEMEDNLVGLIGKDFTGALSSTVGRAVGQLGKGDFKTFDRTLEKIPLDQRQQFVLTALNDAFTTGSREQKQLSAPGFVDWYDGLSRNTEAKRRLEQYLPQGAVNTLQDIATVARGMRQASKERITTGRLNSLKILEEYADEGGLLSKIWDVSKKVGAAEGVTSSIGLPGVGTASVMTKILSKDKEPINQAAEKLMGSQRFKDAIAAATNVNGAQLGRLQARESQLMRTVAYRNWFAALGENARNQIAAVGPLAYLTGERQTRTIELPPTVVTP